MFPEKERFDKFVRKRAILLSATSALITYLAYDMGKKKGRLDGLEEAIYLVEEKNEESSSKQSTDDSDNNYGFKKW